ncbi:MAG: HlyD family efflux transporter periplasmic adaptor subunit [Euryarchaeota archaeon]|nr:HlyD family efflux transporter periplasmic adaptor subunit [Euryarchaeota archaeon]
MKKKKLIIIIGVIVVVLASGSFATFKVKGMMKPEKKADRVEIVRRGPFVVKLSERGNLDSLVKVEVKSNVEGEIDKLYVDEGYDVVKGQQLLKIDEKQIKEEHTQAKANYDAALAELDRAKENSSLNMDRLKSDILLAKNSLDSSKANLTGTIARSSQQLSQARISITNLESLLAQDEISLKKANLTLEQAETNKKTALAKMNNAKDELDRKKDLYAKKFVPLRDVENAQLGYTSAQTEYESTGNNIKSQKESIQSQENIIENRKASIKSEKDDIKTITDSIAEQKKQAEIQIQQAQERLDVLTKSVESEKQIAGLALKTAEANKVRAQSSLNTAQQRLGWTTVIAPMSGRIVQCQVEEGEIITSGRTAFSQGPPIMTIADLSQMIVKTQVHEYDISKVKIGQKAEIEVDSYKDDVFNGVVKEISPSAQFLDNIVKFEVTVMVVNSPKPLLPGMTASVDIIVSERDNVLQLPLEAVNLKETTKIKTDIRKEMLNKIKGQKVDIAGNRFAEKKFGGKVTDIAPEKPGFSTSEVTITMDETPKELQAGTSPSIDIIILSNNERIANVEARIESVREYYVRIPKDTAVGSELPRPKTGFLRAGSKPEESQDEEKVIKVGERTQSSIEILDGLKEGDKVKIVPIGEEDKNKKKEKKG